MYPVLRKRQREVSTVQLSELLRLPDELILTVLRHLDIPGLLELSRTCYALHEGPAPGVVGALRGNAVPLCSLPLPYNLDLWTVFNRRKAGWAPVAVYNGNGSALFVMNSRMFTLSPPGGESAVRTFAPFPSMENTPIRSVSAGYGCFAAIAPGGAVYTWGLEATTGCLGHGDRIPLEAPARVMRLKKYCVITVSIGNGHCLAVADSGCVFAWGSNVFGQCGVGEFATLSGAADDELWPRRLDTFALLGRRVRGAWAGGFHSLVVTECGALYAFGSCSDGKLGLGDDVGDTFYPELVSGIGKIRSAAAGDSHSLALREDGIVLSWGENYKYQLGAGGDRVSVRDVRYVPGPVVVIKDVSTVKAAMDTSCAVTVTGELFLWGECLRSDGVLRRIQVPTSCGSFGGEVVASVSTGRRQSLVVTGDGVVFGWDANGPGIRRYPGISCTDDLLRGLA